jgi:hypothetical protein
MFLDFLSMKAAYLILQQALRESGAYLDENAQSYAFALLRHAVGENTRADQASGVSPQLEPTVVLLPGRSSASAWMPGRLRAHLRCLTTS